MSDRPSLSREHWQRIERFVNGECGDDDVHALEELLRGNSAAQKLLLDYSQLHLDLGMEIGLEASSDAVIEHVARSAKSHADDRNSRGAVARLAAFAAGLWSPMPWASIGALLVLGGGLLGWMLRGEEAIPPTARRAASAEAVAYLATANSCSWGGDNLELWTVGRSINSGDELTLHEGIAEFHLINGVSLSIEGPAAVVLASPSSLVLRYGKLTAHVPRAVADFRMITAACRLSAHDAECGISLSGATLDVHVFSGEVRAVSSLAAADVGDLLLREGGSVVADDDGFFANAVITAGRALTLISQADVLKVSRWSKAAPSMFATKLPMSGALPIATDYINAVRRSNPAGYWRFESLHNAAAENEIPGGMPLRLNGNARLSGDPRNRAVEFGHTGSHAYLIGESSCETLSGAGYSVEFWAKPNHFHRGGMIALMEDPAIVRGQHALLLETHGAVGHFQLQQPKRIRFLHRDPPSAELTAGTSCYSKEEYLVRRWQHIVATKDDGQIRLYVNGTLTGKGEDRSNLSTELRLVVGWTGAGMDDGRYFIGRLDELAVYDRALAAKEILQHYKAVRWNTEGKLDDSI